MLVSFRALRRSQQRDLFGVCRPVPEGQAAVSECERLLEAGPADHAAPRPSTKSGSGGDRLRAPCGV
eukprot:1717031-Pyramimonas_sp.AAC.1